MQVIKNNALFTQVAVEESSFVSGGIVEKTEDETCKDTCHYSKGGLVKAASSVTLLNVLIPEDTGGNPDNGLRNAVLGDILSDFLFKH